jgi:hypothetical protein
MKINDDKNISHHPLPRPKSSSAIANSELHFPHVTYVCGNGNDEAPPPVPLDNSIPLASIVTDDTAPDEDDDDG